MSLPILGTNTLSSGFEVANSCRFNDGDSPRLHKTPGSAGNRRTFTFSFWVKRCTLGAYQPLFDIGGNWADFKDDDTLRVGINATGSSSTHRVTNRVFRDVSAWYHIVIRVDTTQGTAANRLRIYINGTEETSMGTSADVTQDADTDVNNTGVHDILNDQSRYFDGYAAEIVLLDGTSAAPTEFGEFDEDSPTIWKPKDVSGLSFGTNGFYLDFEDSGNLGNDIAGNGDLTEVNLAAADQASDTPTNNACTLNPIFKTGAWSSSTGTVTLSEGNCHLAEGTHAVTCGTIAIPNGKWYWEFKPNGSDYMFGVTGTEPAGNNAYSYYDSTSYGIYVESSGGWWITGGSKVDQTTYTGTGTYMIAIDVDNQKLWFGEGGTWTGDPANGTGNSVTLGTHLYIPWFHSAGTAGDNSADVNFGGCSAFTVSSGNSDGNGYGNFEYSVPNGFYALNTKNLAEYG